MHIIYINRKIKSKEFTVYIEKTVPFPIGIRILSPPQYDILMPWLTDS